MDPAAIAELTVEMWVTIRAKLIARSQQDIDPQIQAMILSEAMKLYMTHIINEKRSSAPGAPPQQEGKPATDKQIAFIRDLGGDPSKVSTSFEASKYIEELKQK